MRALSTSDERLQSQRGGVRRRVRVSVKDGGGTFRDLTTYLGKDFVLAGSWGETVDSNGLEASFEVMRQDHKLNVSPYMTKSAANLAFAFPGSYAPLIEVGREILVEWAIAPSGAPDSVLSWVKAMRGHVDSHDPTGGTVKFTARGRYGQVLDAFIEEERVYAHADPLDADSTKGLRMYLEGAGFAVNELVMPGESKRNGQFYKVTGITTGIGGAEGTWPTGGGSVTFGGVTLQHRGTTTTSTGTALETVLQQIVNDNMSAPITINTPVSPGWLIKWYAQARTGTWTALRALVDQIGWDLRDVWHSGTSDLRFELRDPNRAKVVPDRTFGPGDRYALTRLEKRLDGIRNRIKVWYFDSADLDAAGRPRKKFVVVEDAASISKYGRRFMEVSEASTSTIDTSAEALAFANAMLSDLAEPNAEQECEFPFFPFVELTDLYRFTSDEKHYDANTDLAVVGYMHSFRAARGGSSTVRTSITCRGKPSTGYERWLRMDAGRNTEAHQWNVHGKFQTNNILLDETDGGVGTAQAKVEESFAKMALPMGIDFHFSKSPSFSPSNATLYQSGYANQHTMQGDPGDTYYGATVPWQWNAQKKIYGAKSAEFTVVPGYLEPKHINPEKFRGELPPNGSFEGFTRAGGITVPPDNWEMDTGDWGTDVVAGPAGGGSADAKDGARYLEFTGTNVATSARSKWFPVNGSNAHELRAWVMRVSGDNDIDLEIEWAKSDKSPISTSSLLIDLGDLTADVWSYHRTVFLAPDDAAFARAIVRKDAAHTSEFNVDGMRIDDLGEPWITIPDADLDDGWVTDDAPSPAATVAYRYAQGLFEMRGAVKDGATGGGNRITVLPFAPPQLMRWSSISASDTHVDLHVNTSGELIAMSGDNTWVSLDCVRFRVF